MKKWREVVLVFAFSVFAISIAASENPAKYNSLSDLYPEAELRDKGPLNIQRGSITTRPSIADPSILVRQLEISFTSQTYLGKRADHEAVLVLPQEITEPASGKAAIILGKNALNVPAESAAELDRVDWVVTELGIPVLIIKNIFSAAAYGVRNAGAIMDLGQAEALKTGNPRLNGYYALSRIFTAAATVLENTPELGAKQFVVSGGSKGGMAAWLAAAGDPRIVGAYPTAWSGGNILKSTELRGERWGWDEKPKPTGPAGMTAREMLAAFESERSRELLRFLDPIYYDDLLTDEHILFAVGTNDPLFHLLAGSRFVPLMSSDIAVMHVPNFGHGGGSPRHVTAWRMWLAYCFHGRPVPGISIKVSRKDGFADVLATVTSSTEVTGVKLHTTADPKGDYRKAKWISVSMKPADGGYRASVKLPDKGKFACFAEVTDESSFGPGLATSLITEIDAD